MVEGAQIYVTGYIAARLESLAEAGGICISDTAYAQVRDKLAITMKTRASRRSRISRVRCMSGGCYRTAQFVTARVGKDFAQASTGRRVVVSGSSDHCRTILLVQHL